MSKADPPTDNPMDNYLGYHLRRVTAALVSDIGASLSPLKLRPSEASILIYMRHNPGQNQSEIGQALSIKRANMTPLITGLASRGLCTRAPADGRSSALLLTDAGLDVATRAEDIFDDHEGRCFGELGGGDRARLLSLLQKVRAG